MAHRPNPPDQDAAALGLRQQALHERLKRGSERQGLATHLIGVSCGHSEPLPTCPMGTGGLGLCSSCQQSEPLAHG
jgi:hypothetical protein